MKKIITLTFLFFAIFSFAQQITSVVPAQYCKGDYIKINTAGIGGSANNVFDPFVTIGDIPTPIVASGGDSSNGFVGVFVPDASEGLIRFHFNSTYKYYVSASGGYIGASNAGSILGPAAVCTGQNAVIYSVPAIANATSYQWTLPIGASGTSTTNTISVNFGSTALSGDITVKGVSSCGNGQASKLPISVDILPSSAAVITGTTTICELQNAVVYSVPVIANATSYEWTLPSGATGTSTTNSISVNFGSSVASGNITVKGINCYGAGAGSTKPIIVNPRPATAGTITGTTTICSLQNAVVYSVPAIANATSYEWILSSGATGTSTTNSISLNFGSSAVSGNIAVAGVNNCGYGLPSKLAITVNPFPSSAGAITGTTTVCQGQNAVIYSVSPIANANSYQWTLPSGATGTSTSNSINVNFGASAVSSNIKVNGLNSCGAGSASTLAITVPVPSRAGAIIGTSTVCQGQTAFVYSVPAIANATSIQWTLPSGATGTSTNNSIKVDFGTAAVSGNISVSGVNSCGVGQASTFAITINKLPSNPGAITGLSTVCTGLNNVVYSVPVIANATSYQWTLPSGATGASTTNSISVNYGLSAVSGNISVKGVSGCGIGVEATLTISVNTTNTLPSSAQTISGLTSVCVGQNNVLYTVPVIANATSYKWTLPSGATGISTTNSISVNYGLSAVSGYIIVRGVNCYGIGSTIGGLYVNVNTKLSNAGFITGDSTVCQGQRVLVYSVPGVEGATSYEWVLPNGATGTSTTNSITVDYGVSAVSGTITVKGVNSCGAGFESGKIVSVINCSLPSNNFKLEVTDPTCQTKANGKLKITATASYNYTATMDGVNYTFTNNVLDITNFAPKTYTICIKVPALNNYTQCFEFTVKSAPGLTAKTRMDTKGNKTTANVSIESGTAPYTVEINGKTIDVTFENQLNIPVQNGDLLEIKTSIACEGKIRERVSLSNELMAYPNPTSNFVELFIPNTFQKKYVMIQMVDNSGKSVVNREFKVIDNSIIIPMENLSVGLYIINVQLETLQTIKIIKK